MLRVTYLSAKQLVEIQIDNFQCKLTLDNAERFKEMLKKALKEGGRTDKNSFIDGEYGNIFGELFKKR